MGVRVFYPSHRFLADWLASRQQKCTMRCHGIIAEFMHVLRAEVAGFAPVMADTGWLASLPVSALIGSLVVTALTGSLRATSFFAFSNDRSSELEAP